MVGNELADILTGSAQLGGGDTDKADGVKTLWDQVTKSEEKIDYQRVWPAHYTQRKGKEEI